MPETVRVQALDSRWETLGVDRFPGIHPQGLDYTYSDWGPDSATFALKRDPTLDHPDLAEFTPLDIEDGGALVWSGFVIDTPAGEDGLTVSALGWHYHLDDDVYSPYMIDEDLGAFVDVRSTLEANLSTHQQAGRVDTGQGILLSWPTGSNPPTGIAVAVTYDAGEHGRVRRVAVDYDQSDNYGASFLYVIGSDVPDWTLNGGGRVDYVSALDQTAAPASGQAFGTSVNGKRYVTIVSWLNVGPGAPFATDVWWRIKRIRMFADPAYESGGGSNVGARTLILDALPKAPKLSQRTDRIGNGGLALTSYHARNEDRTPREVMEFGNAFHGWRLMVTPERELIWTPQANRPLLQVNVGESGARWLDTSTNSGREVYNRVVARGRTGSGRPVYTEVSAKAALDKALAPQVPNPGADVDVAGWTIPANTTLVRNTGAYVTAPACFNLGASVALGAGGGMNVSAQTVGLFRAGVRYRFSVSIYLAAHVTASAEIEAAGGTFDVRPLLVWNSRLDGAGLWITKEITFTPKVDVGTCVVRISGTWQNAVAAGNVVLSYDDVDIAQPTATQVDRRGYRRSKVFNIGFPVDPVTARALAQAYVNILARPALKGTIEIPADDLVTSVVGGRPIAVRELGRYIGELINLANLIDPVSGAIGRLGVVAGVQVRDGAGTVAIDNKRDSFEALLARMGVTSP